MYKCNKHLSFQAQVSRAEIEKCLIICLLGQQHVLLLSGMLQFMIGMLLLLCHWEIPLPTSITKSISSEDEYVGIITVTVLPFYNMLVTRYYNFHLDAGQSDSSTALIQLFTAEDNKQISSMFEGPAHPRPPSAWVA